MEIKERQYEIIRAAGELLNETGVQGLTTKNLAAKIGVAEGTLYRHFKSKDDIIATMSAFALASTKERLLNSFEKNIAETDQIIDFFEAQMKFVAQHPYLLNILFTNTGANTGCSQENQLEMIIHIGSKVTEAIAKGQQKGTIRHDISVDMLAHIAMSAYRMMVLRWALVKFGFDLEKETKKISESIIVLYKNSQP